MWPKLLVYRTLQLNMKPKVQEKATSSYERTLQKNKGKKNEPFTFSNFIVAVYVIYAPLPWPSHLQLFSHFFLSLIPSHSFSFFPCCSLSHDTPYPILDF